MEHILPSVGIHSSRRAGEGKEGCQALLHGVFGSLCSGWEAM